ncbi:MAG: hypothetical protein QXX68_01125 [Candidatus Pacearchaeota archaeon]
MAIRRILLIKELFLILFLLTFLLSLSSAILSTPSVCCERTKSGGACLNSAESECDSSFRIAPSFCEQTSFCKTGTCYDSKEGLCMENVPQQVCQDRNGTWSEKKASEIPTCRLGCCIIADQAALVTLARCKKLSTYYGISMDFRASVTDEGECIFLANSQDMGACVTYTGTGVNECKFTTRKECGAKDGVIALNVNKSILEQETGKKFYKDVLCSAEELHTECARQTSVGCYKGKVYWFDSCGNRENVYSSDKDKSWNRGRVADPDEICPRSGGSNSCGNCDYLLGSVCARKDGKKTTDLGKEGEYICKKTTCKDMSGKTRLNGESWCVYDIEPGKGYEKVGSRHFRQICIDGEVVTDPCADYRKQICIHSGIQTSAGEFSTAACRVNRWQDCIYQWRKKDCENIDVRDCIWIDDVEGLNWNKAQQQTSSFSNPTPYFQNPTSGGQSGVDTAMQAAGLVQQAAPFFTNPTGKVITGKALNPFVSSGKGIWEFDYDILNKVTKFNKSEVDEGGLCVPLIPPGNKFWLGEGNCNMASAVCKVIIERTEKYSSIAGPFGDKEYEFKMVNESGVEVTSECLEWEGGSPPKGSSKSYSLIPKHDWAVKVNAICTSLGDCGANVNINDKYTDDGYSWKYKNSSFSLLGNLKQGHQTRGTGFVIKERKDSILINDRIEVRKGSYVLLKKEDKYSLKQIEEIKVGDVIVASDGEEIRVEKLSFPQEIKQQTVIKEDKTFAQKMWEKLAGKEIPKKIVSGGSSEEGLSLGEYGTGIKFLVEEK